MHGPMSYFLFKKRVHANFLSLMGSLKFDGLQICNGPRPTSRREKTCLRGFDKVRFKPACSATETS